MSNSLETLEREEEAPAAPVARALAPMRQGSVEGRGTKVEGEGERRNPIAPVEDEEDDEPGFFGRHWIKLLVAGLVIAGGAALAFKKPSAPTPPARKAEPQMVRVQLPPPPPPPPPKIQPPPPPEQKMVEQKPIAEDEKPPDEPKDEPPKADEPPALGTNIRGSGAGDGFGLGSSGNGGRIGGGGSGGGGSRFGWYGGQVQSRIQQALQRNPKTRQASFDRVTVKIWVDSTGRITRAKLAQSTGDAAVDSAIEQEALIGQQLTEPPPAGMIMPINLRLTARRP